MQYKKNTLFGDISDPEKLLLNLSINSTINNIARAFFSLLTETGIWLQMVWGLCSYCLYMGTFKLGVVIVFAAGQWDIRSCFPNGHFGIMDCIALIDLKSAYDVPFIL